MLKNPGPSYRAEERELILGFVLTQLTLALRYDALSTLWWPSPGKPVTNP